MNEPAEAPDRVVHDPHAVQDTWLPVWDRLDLNRAGLREGAEKRYLLDMFPYPSGDLHMGHAEAWAIGDVVARAWMRQGYDVLHPVGWDSFGLPAENAAIARNAHPAEWTYANIETQADSFRRYAVSFDWSTRLHTSDPDYYRWTQWLFLRFLEKGLAYRKKSSVNWCPVDQTVLANEQVIAGLCERCHSPVTKREMTQWYFKITEYAEQLLDDMSLLEAGWPRHVLVQQRNWIGKSVGAHVDFLIGDRTVTVFTTRPDTLYGATFFVVAVDAPLAAELVSDAQREAFEAYREQVKTLSDIDRQSTDRPKTGVDLGVTATNPLNGEQLPVFAADYVLADYGTGAIMAVPAHDQRDLDFARAFDLPVRVVVDTGEADPAESGIATTGDGVLVNSGPLDGLSKDAAIARAIEVLADRGTGSEAVNYRLRDWLVSRQRFWGAPIPVVHCERCGEVAVPDDQLPVLLPADMKGAELQPKGQAPLASNDAFVNVPCPACGEPAKRDTDTMDTFVDSSWYFLRYCSPHYEDGPFDQEAVRTWLPVTQYVGGVEHAILHLLYSRFFTKVLRDLGMVSFDEPFLALMNQGQVINQGKSMSKSLGNGVDLGEQLAAYGVDAIRLSIVFAGPPEEDIDWADVSPGGSLKWLARVVRLATDIGELTGEATDPGVDRAVAKAVDEVTRLVDSRRLNVCVARFMELTNVLRKAVDGGQPAAGSLRAGAHALATMLSCFAPYTAEEMWAQLGHDPAAGDSVHASSWPIADPALVVDELVTCIVQVSGKVRDKIEVPVGIGEDDLRELALALPKIQDLLGGAAPRTVIVKPPRVVNVVPA